MSAVRATEQYSVDELKKMNKKRLEVIDTREARKRRQKERDQIRLKVAGFVGFLCVVMFALVVLIPFQRVVSEIYVTSYSVSELKQEIKRLETVKLDLEAKYDACWNLDELRVKAEVYGMVKAGPGDYLDIASLPKKNEASDQSPESKEAKNSN